MKVFIIACLISALDSFILSAQQTPRSIIVSDFYSLGYLEYLPPNYNSEAKKFPVLIFLHGGGEAGDGTPADLDKVKSWGPPKHIGGGHNMCFTTNGEENCFIVISPQIDSKIYDWPPFVKLLIDHILDQYNADPDRIYLTGLSRGGNGVYLSASSYWNKPNKLAAIAPMAAWFDDLSYGCTIAERGIPIWAFHGKEDTIVPYAAGLSAFNSIDNCMDPEPSAELIFTTYEDRYHDSWIPAYDPSHTYHDPNLYEWLLLHSRVEEVDPVTDVMEYPKEKTAGLLMFPNPAKDNIHLSIRDFSGKAVTVKISNLHGELVLSLSNDLDEIDISSMSPGVYVLQVVDKKGIFATERLVKID